LQNTGIEVSGIKDVTPIPQQRLPSAEAPEGLMARYTGPACRLCRREKMKLFLKGPKCDSMKCPIERRPYPPGEHGRGRIRESEYLLQLREKQKARRIYGRAREAVPQRLCQRPTPRRHHGREPVAPCLEQRLDNVVYRAGWAASRAQARQFVRTGT